MSTYSSSLKAALGIFAIVILAAFSILPLPAEGAGQAALFLNPASGSFLVGSTFDVSIVLDTKGTSVNAVEVELDFPADKIQIANPSIGSSIIQLWTAPPAFSNREGKIYFVGGIPSPGIVTSQGVVLTLTFRVVAPGQGQIFFGDKTSILANDGLGTNVLGQKPPAFFTFLVPPPQGPQISSPTHPDQERWYKDNNVVFVWSRGSFTSGYSYSIDRDPTGFPDTISEGVVPTVSYQNIDNGIWYFHLREQAGGVWGGVSHYVVKIDGEPPASFRVNVSPARRTTNRSPIYRFFTTDAFSGFDHFEMKIIPLSGVGLTEAFFFEVSSPHQMANLEEGRYQVIVRALDKAGNARDEVVTTHIVGPFSQFISPEGVDLVFIFLPWQWVVNFFGILLLIFLLILFILWRKHKHHLHHAFREDVKKILHLSKKVMKKNGLTHAIFIAVVAFSVYAGTVFAVSESPPVQPPHAPVISVAPSVYYPLDEVLYLEGKAAPEYVIDIVFEKPGSQPVRVRTEANSNGEWFFAQKLELASGEWTVRARSIAASPSDWSNPRIIRSSVTGIIFGSIKLRYLPIVISFVVMLLVSLGLLLYSLLRVRTIQRLELEHEISQKTKELEKALRDREKEAVQSAIESEFAELRRNLTEELSHFDKKLRDGGELTKDEFEHRADLLREMNRIENEIGKKLKNIV